ncbi:hypothetical protein NECAME_10657 [Necator americanus]|uniref:Uncharacterized protein n=1 Tax=Necator americanus TaxID=51031 RepID=W2TAC1_NECAM|nr:hypothetical protein NECAME_10657 [Necator americanus]ETN77957.1 hypothetical protein NECAME_10657 [Necator americanus]
MAFSFQSSMCSAWRATPVSVDWKIQHHTLPSIVINNSALCRRAGEPTMGKDYKYGGYHYGYSQAPTAPSMEITINQNGADSAKNPYQTPGPVGRGRPPLSAPPHPPPPPPSYGGYEHPAYNPLWFDRFPRRENRGMFRLCLVELMLAGEPRNTEKYECNTI